MIEFKTPFVLTIYDLGTGREQKVASSNFDLLMESASEYAFQALQWHEGMRHPISHEPLLKPSMPHFECVGRDELVPFYEAELGAMTETQFNAFREKMHEGLETSLDADLSTLASEWADYTIETSAKLNTEDGPVALAAMFEQRKAMEMKAMERHIVSQMQAQMHSAMGGMPPPAPRNPDGSKKILLPGRDGIAPK